jgi:hypothetical protein
MAKAEFHEGSFSKVEPLHLTVQESQGSNEVSTFPFISLKFLFYDPKYGYHFRKT